MHALNYVDKWVDLIVQPRLRVQSHHQIDYIGLSDFLRETLGKQVYQGTYIPKAIPRGTI